MKKKHLIPLLLVFIGLAALSFTTASGVTLRLKPQKDKTYSITATSYSTARVGEQSFSLSSDQTMTTRQSFTAKDVSANKIVINSQIDAIKATMSMMSMKLEYDSESSEEPHPLIADQAKEYEKNLKKPFSITYNATGKNVNNKKELPMSQLGSVIIPLPKNAVNVGSKWSSENSQEINGMQLKVNMDYNVTEISETSVEVSFSGSVKAKDTSGTLTGTASIDPETGLVTKSTTRSNISTKLREKGRVTPVNMTATTHIVVE